MQCKRDNKVVARKYLFIQFISIDNGMGDYVRVKWFATEPKYCHQVRTGANHQNQNVHLFNSFLLGLIQ